MRAALLILLGAAAALPAEAASGGRLATLMLGRYECERPGPPGGAAAVPEPQASFRVTASSRYVAADGSHGTYLRTGDVVTMTSGPLDGTRLRLVSGKFLRRLEPGGAPGPVRCVLARGSDKH